MAASPRRALPAIHDPRTHVEKPPRRAADPNIAHHWAHDLGINRRFEDWSPEFGWWLEKRIKTMEGFATPTGVVTRRP